MIRWRRQGLAWLVLAIYLLPAPALAQSTKAGVVTTLEGNVTAVRAVAPQPVALKFKDDVFLQDRVVTGEQAFARLLLGGKAVISIRERSAVTITEVPGRSTVEIESGKIALSVARERMLPGEVINIKTPNAIAGVRGTVVVAQVTYRQGRPFTNLWVLRGIIDAIHTNVTGAPLSQPVPVGERESFNADQATATKGAFTLEEVGTIVQGLQPQRTQDVGSASQSPARLEAVNTAVALLGALVGSGGQQQMALLTGPPPPIPAPKTTPEQTVTVAPITSLSNPVTEHVLLDQQKCSQGDPAACAGLGQSPPTGQPPPADTPDVIINDTTVALGAADTLKTFTGTSTRPGTSPLIRITDSTVNGPASTLVTALPDANATLTAGPLMKVTDSTLDVLRLLHVQGSLTSLSAAPLIALDPVTVNAQTLVEIAAGGGLSLAGPLLTDLNGVIATAQGAISVAGTLMSTGPGALVALQGTNLAVGAPTSEATFARFLNVFAGSPTSPGPVPSLDASVGLVGSLLSARAAKMTTTGDVVGVLNGGLLAQSSGAALLQFDDTTLAVGNASLLSRLLLVTGGGGTSGTTPATAVITGALLNATNSQVTTTGNGVGVFNGAAFASLGAPLFLLDRTSLTTGRPAFTNEFEGALFHVAGTVAETPAFATLQGPLLSAFNSSTVTAHGNVMQVALGAAVLGLGAGPLIQTSNSTLWTDFDVLAAYDASTVALAGPLLLVGGGSLHVARRIVGVFNGSEVIATAGDPFVSLIGGAHVLGTDPNSLAFTVGSDPGSRLSVPGTLLALNGASVTMSGPFLQVTPPGVLSVGGPLLDMSGGSLTSATPNPFISFGLPPTAAPITPAALTASQLLRLTGAANLTLHGSLLFAKDTAFTATDASRAAFAIADGASLTTTGTAAPLFSFVGSDGTSSQVTTARQFLTLTGTPAPSMTLSGPLLSANRTTIHTGNPTATGNTPANPFGLIFLGDSATLTSTTPSPLLSFVDSTADLAGTVLSARRSTSLSAPTSVTLAGSLIFASNSTITTTSSGFNDFFGTTGVACCPVVSLHQGARLTTTQDLPLIQLSNATVNVGPDARSGSSLFLLADALNGAPAGELVAPSTAALAGPLLTATNSTISTLFQLIQVTNSTLSSTTPSALVSLSGGSLALGGPNPIVGGVSFARVLSLTGAGASIALQGPLFASNGAVVTTTGDGFGVFDNALLSSTTSQPLIQISGGSFTGSAANFIAIASAAGLSPTVRLAGPLLSASATAIRNGDPTANVFGSVFIGDGAQVSSTSTPAFLRYDGATVDTSGGFFVVRRSLSPTQLTRLDLAGPLFRAINGSTFNATSLGTTSACCTGFNVQQGGQLVATTNLALIQLVDSVFDAGPDAQSGGNFIGLTDSGLNGPLTASATVSLAGPLVSSTTSNIRALFSALSVTRSTLTSTSPDALIQLNGTRANAPALLLGGLNPFGSVTTTGRLLSVVSSVTSGQTGLPASVSLAGPLLDAVSAPIQLTGDVIGIFNGASVSSTSTSPFVRLNDTTLTAGVSGDVVVNGRIAFVSGVGGPDGGTPASLTLSGPLLEASNSTPDNSTFVDVRGANGNVVRLDAALLAATAPLIALTGSGTRLQTSGNAIDLANNASLQSLNASEGLIRIENQARMDVLNGHLVSVSLSRLNVAGDLVRMGNGALLNVNGVLLNVLNGGIVNINGALVNFTGINATINVTNTLAPNNFFNGVPVFVAAGAVLPSIGAGSLAGLNAGNNIIRINGTQLPTGATTASGITGSLINVGANGTVRIAGTN